MPKQQSFKKLIFLTSIGAGFEYYDFVVYAMLAHYLSSCFFPQLQAWLSYVQLFAVFAVGYLVRPLGGFIFAYLGDRLGRKAVYYWVVSLMSASSLGIALLPGYQQIGAAAPLLLLSLRMLQGVSLGAELPGSVILLAEHAPYKYRGLACGLQIACVGLGAAGATFLCAYLQQHLSAYAMLSFGWRLLFLFGGLLALVAAYARRRVTESPLFLQQQTSTSKKPLLAYSRNLIGNHKTQLLQALGILWLPASLVMLVLSLPSILHSNGYALAAIYPAMSVGYLWCALCIPLFAYLADRIGRRWVFAVGAVLGCAVFSVMLPQLHAASAQHRISLLLLLVILQTWQAVLSSCYFTRLVEVFPTAVRYGGYALTYNVTYAVCGMLPMLLTRLNHSLSPHMFNRCILGYFLVACMVGVFAMLKSHDLLDNLSQVQES